MVSPVIENLMYHLLTISICTLEYKATATHRGDAMRHYGQLEALAAGSDP